MTDTEKQTAKFQLNLMYSKGQITDAEYDNFLADIEANVNPFLEE